MSARVEINLNLRFEDGKTMVDLDEDVVGPIEVLDQVQVVAPDLELVGRGWITQIDTDDRTATVQVEWGTLKRESTITVGSLGRRQTSNLQIDAQDFHLVGA